MHNMNGSYKTLRLLQITDTHLYREPAGTLLGFNTHDSFNRIVELIRAQQPNPDIIVATGDIAQDASRESYLRFAQTVSMLGAPFYWIPGNHDRRSVMKEIPGFENKFVQRIERGNWQIIMLDTSVSGDVHGLLSEAELDHLEQSLARVGDHQAIEHSLICLHHNPVPGNATWMQDIGLQNAATFIDLIRRFDSVRGVVYGHIHQSLDFEHQGIRFFCTPSTCIQFKPDAEDFELDMLNPAYRWFDLHADGTLQTSVERLPHFDIQVDRDAGGY
jgi:3',5'-cyclic-AMP phosphodiesterase